MLSSSAVNSSNAEVSPDEFEGANIRFTASFPVTPNNDDACAVVTIEF